MKEDKQPKVLRVQGSSEVEEGLDSNHLVGGLPRDHPFSLLRILLFYLATRPEYRERHLDQRLLSILPTQNQ